MTHHVVPAGTDEEQPDRRLENRVLRNPDHQTVLQEAGVERRERRRGIIKTGELGQLPIDNVRIGCQHVRQAPELHSRRDVADGGQPR